MAAWSDSSQGFQLGFQDPASNWMIGIIDLHDNIMFYLIIVFFLVSIVLINGFLNPDHLRYLSHGNKVEVIWTICPAILLWKIGLPSLKLLYMMDEIKDAEITVKAIGFQWGWTYSYGDYIKEDQDSNEGLTFESFMVPNDDLDFGSLRQLAVDNFLVLPVNTSIRLIVTSNDVIHSFAIPSLGIKSDALPGRLNSMGFIINRPALLFGQCSELCGVFHSAMPIGIQAVNLPDFLLFLNSQI
jgi:cytochrome c oxidase subunit 2